MMQKLIVKDTLMDGLEKIHKIIELVVVPNMKFSGNLLFCFSK